jgi:surface-anchored protein
MKRLVLPAWIPVLGICASLLSAAAEGEETNRVRLIDSHVDIAVAYQPADETNKLAVVVRDDDSGRTYRSNEVALVAVEAAKLDLPPGTVFGEAGAPLWVLPQSQSPGILYVGLSGEGVSPGLFGAFDLRLIEVRGPGSVFVWQAGSLGDFDLRFNSADGVTAADAIPVLPGGHSHFNWGFTTNGVFEVVLQVSGQRAGVGTNDFSLPTALRFEVEPLPPEPEAPFARWQQDQWPGETDPALIGPDADPDADTVPNAVEYALGLNPHQPDRGALPQPRIRLAGSVRMAVLEFQHPAGATDVQFSCWSSAAIPSTNWVSVAGPNAGPPSGDRENLSFAAGPVTPETPVYLRLEVTLVRPVAVTGDEVCQSNEASATASARLQ